MRWSLHRAYPRWGKGGTPLFDDQRVVTADSLRIDASGEVEERRGSLARARIAARRIHPRRVLSSSLLFTACSDPD